MSDNECAICGTDDIWGWPKIHGQGREPRCEDHPPEQCKQCGAGLDGWRGDTLCDRCRDGTGRDVWCETCDGAIRIKAIDYDGVRLECDCPGTSAYADHARVKQTAPLSWRYNGRHGNTRVGGP